MIGFNHVFEIALHVLSSYNGTHRLTDIAGLLCPWYYHVVQSLRKNPREIKKRGSDIRVIDLQMSRSYLNWSAMCDTCIEGTRHLSMPA